MTDITINTLSQRLNTRTLHFVLLSMVTCGVWPLLWLYKKQDIISETALRQSVYYLAHRLFRAQSSVGCHGST